MFEERTSKPQGANPYYIRKAEGGYSPCILGNEKHRDPVLNVLPNCVGWAVGRFNEIACADSCKYLGSVDAGRMVDYARAQGLEIGTEPKLGAAVVWQGGDKRSNGSYMGHIGIVEAIHELEDKPSDEIIVSQGGWSSSLPMWTGAHKRGLDGNWIQGYDYTWMSKKDYKLVGFIYQPEEIVEMTDKEFAEMADRYFANLKKQGPSLQGEAALKWANEKGYILGNKNGDYMAKSFLTREQFAIVLKRIFDKK